MKHILSAALVAVSLLSYSQEAKKAPAKLNVKVVNTEDPICGMKTAQFLKDTVTYNKKLYGFCGTHCKEAFKKEPKKYVKK
ncbi:hypothetical protein GCM10010992_07300 [Cloacibacterium rupense]|uniref:YHS domain-containing protein n=1 Tax=Cloacibacterium rupense TaxID=517423 RepID=A0ABQ2NJ59_9FLAO|nr:YHS domain-containing protein [Cloacibacterium rupense]GGP02534.1 hypothetical protein GCM10010992_07300 [Cloacibacterium rupense]